MRANKRMELTRQSSRAILPLRRAAHSETLAASKAVFSHSRSGGEHEQQAENPNR